MTRDYGDSEGIPSTASEPTCPFMDKPCPKVDDLEREVDSVKDMVKSMQRTLYLIAGILIAELGVTII